MSRPTLYIMCGLPFSGKTTLAHALTEQCGFLHIDMDSLARTKGFSTEQGIEDVQWGKLFHEAHQHLGSLLASGKSVVFDAVNYDRVGRNRLRDIAQQNGCITYVIYVSLSVLEIEERRKLNQHDFHRPYVRTSDFLKLAKEFEVPTCEENVLIYDRNKSVTEWIKFYGLQAG